MPERAGAGRQRRLPEEVQHIVVTKEKIELKQKVYFDTNKATIQPRCFALLDEVAEVLKSRPEIKVRIEGHTDSRGNVQHNMKLSQERAESVRQYLVGLGVERRRMEARGFGPTQPIETTRRRRGARTIGASSSSSRSNNEERRAP